MKYSEERDASRAYKQNYINGLEELISKRQKRAEKIRKEYIKDVFKDPERYRADLKNMLGWPLNEPKENGEPHVVIEKLSDENGYSIYRMQFDVLQGLTMTGLLFKLDKKSKEPLVIVQHGTLGTPEFISGIYGDTTNYNDIVKRVINQGVHVFAPQTLLWRKEYNVEFDRQAIDDRLKRVGSSIVAVEIYGVERIIDYFETKEYVSSIGMIGLSAGGIYTLYTAAVDTRIRSAITCSFFNKKDDFKSGSWTWQNSAEMFDDAEVACLIYPRRLCIEIGDNDELFDHKVGEEQFEYLKELSRDVGTDWVDFIVFPGKHEFYKGDKPISRLVNDLK